MKELTYEDIVTVIENKRRFGNLSGARITEKMLEVLVQKLCNVLFFVFQ